MKQLNDTSTVRVPSLIFTLMLTFTNATIDSSTHHTENHSLPRAKTKKMRPRIKIEMIVGVIALGAGSYYIVKHAPSWFAESDASKLKESLPDKLERLEFILLMSMHPDDITALQGGDNPELAQSLQQMLQEALRLQDQTTNAFNYVHLTSNSATLGETSKIRRSWSIRIHSDKIPGMDEDVVNQQLSWLKIKYTNNMNLKSKKDRLKIAYDTTIKQVNAHLDICEKYIPHRDKINECRESFVRKGILFLQFASATQEVEKQKYPEDVGIPV